MQLPWTNSCFVCGQDNPRGFRLRPFVDGGRVVVVHTVGAHDAGWRGVMHGGLTMTLLDEVMTWAAILGLRTGCVSAELTVRLQAPIREGDEIRVEGWTSRARSRLALVEGRVVLQNDHETILATAGGKYVPAPDQTGGFSKDFVPGSGDPAFGDMTA